MKGSRKIGKWIDSRRVRWLNMLRSKMYCFVLNTFRHSYVFKLATEAYKSSVDYN